MPAKSIQQVLSEQTSRWMAIPGVVGTAIGESEGLPCIKIFVVEKTEDLAAKFSDSPVDGHPVVLEETDEFRAL